MMLICSPAEGTGRALRKSSSGDVACRSYRRCYEAPYSAWRPHLWQIFCTDPKMAQMIQMRELSMWSTGESLSFWWETSFGNLSICWVWCQEWAGARLWNPGFKIKNGKLFETQYHGTSIAQQVINDHSFLHADPWSTIRNKWGITLLLSFAVDFMLRLIPWLRLRPSFFNRPTSRTSRALLNRIEFSRGLQNEVDDHSQMKRSVDVSRISWTLRGFCIVLHSFGPSRFDDACNKSLGAESLCPRIASRSTVAAIAWKHLKAKWLNTFDELDKAEIGWPTSSQVRSFLRIGPVRRP